MGKVLLFHNNAQPRPPRTYRSLIEARMEDTIKETVLESPYGNRNTGTYLMTDTLRKIVDADEYIPRFYEFHEHVDTVVTNILHRISATLKVDIPYWKNILNHADRVVPLSLGFAFEGNGKKIPPLDNDLDYLLRELAERTELGCRCEYDAEYLCAHGIKNVRVIGCPSLFYHMDRTFRVENAAGTPQRVNFNFSTDFANLGISQREAVETHWPLLLYFKWVWERNTAKVDYTMQKPPFAEISDIHNILLSYGEVHDFYKANGRYFYCVEDWIRGIRGTNDFSMGSRFHGNVAAILAGVPALMVNIDKRMEGLNRYFHIPTIGIEDFSLSRPIQEYVEMADYSEFNRTYAKTYDNFVDYCTKNGVRLKSQ